MCKDYLSCKLARSRSSRACVRSREPFSESAASCSSSCAIELLASAQRLSIALCTSDVHISLHVRSLTVLHVRRITCAHRNRIRLVIGHGAHRDCAACFSTCSSSSATRCLSSALRASSTPTRSSAVTRAFRSSSSAHSLSFVQRSTSSSRRRTTESRSRRPLCY